MQETRGAGGEVEAAADGALPRAPRRGALLLRPDHRHRHAAGSLLREGNDWISFCPADPDLRLSALCRTASRSSARARRRVGECRWPYHRTYCQEPHPQGGRRRQGACCPWRPSRPGAYHLGDGKPATPISPGMTSTPIAPSCGRILANACITTFTSSTPSWA